eukprot:3649613-Ditylum_brightwellii.AAC.1
MELVTCVKPLDGTTEVGVKLPGWTDVTIEFLPLSKGKCAKRSAKIRAIESKQKETLQECGMNL